MSAKYHRYTSNGKGVYQALKDEIFARYGKEEGAKIWKAFLGDPDVTWLKRPGDYPEGASSWFTAAGDRKFVNRTLPKMMEHMDGDKIYKETTTSPGKAVYEDEDQVVAEKKASAKIDIPALYEEVRRAYADMGYPVSGDRLVLSEQPTYVDGRPVPADVMNPNESGGNTQHDGTVRINPRYRAVMRHWGLKGPGRDFLRTIIGHEIGHHIDRTVLGDRPEERRRLLREIAKAKFHTV